MGNDITGLPRQNLSTVVIRDLRRDASIAPGGGGFGDLIRAFLPLVYGSARRLLPEKASSVEEVVAAVFLSFVCRWRSLPRRTVVGSWLLRSTYFAASREYRRLRRAAPELGLADPTWLLLFRKLCRLRPATFDVLLVHGVLGQNARDTGRVLGRRETKVVKLTTRGLAKLDKSLRAKTGGVEARELLARLAESLPDAVEESIVDRVMGWSPREKKWPLVLATLRAWRWRRVRNMVRRVLATVAWCILVIVLAASTLGWLARQGHFTAWFLRQSALQLAKEIPELTQPARPWPDSTGEPSLAAQPPPRTAAELYGLTNIWSVTLAFTAEQWKAIEPSRVPPVPNMWAGGQLVLRNPKAQRNGLAGVIGLDYNWVKGQMEFAGQDFPDVAVRYRGNGTYVNSLFGPKQPFKVDLNKYTKGQRVAGVRTLNFVNAIPDNSYLHDALGEKLFRDLGVPAPRTAYAYLTLKVEGQPAPQPLGLYVLVENIDTDFARDRFGTKDVPLFKPVTPDLFKHLGDDWQAYAGIYDLKTQATPDQLARVIEFARLVSHADDDEFARRLAEFLEVEEVAAFVAGHVLLSAYDGFLANGQNFYLYLDPSSHRFGLIPWDQDHSWGEFGYVATADKRERASIWQPATYAHRFLERLMKVDQFRAAYRGHLERALDQYFTCDRLFREIDQVAAVIRPAVAAESAFRLKRFDQAVSTNWLSGPRDGAPEGPKAPVHQIKRFITNRIQSIRDQLDGRAEGVVLGPPSRENRP